MRCSYWKAATSQSTTVVIPTRYALPITTSVPTSLEAM